MRDRILQIFRENAQVMSQTADALAGEIERLAAEISAAYVKGNQVLICGNGGSAADSQHLAAELIGRFRQERKAVPAIALTTDTSILTAVGNDYGFERVFARQVEGLGRPGDVLVAISTSGNSLNVIRAIEAARARQMTVAVLTGAGGGAMAAMADITLAVPSPVTARVQEAHGVIVHILCELVEQGLQG